MKKILFPILILTVFVACNNEPENTSEPVSEVAPAPAAPEQSNAEKLRNRAIPEHDYHKRVENSLVTLQEEYRKAEGKVTGVGKVTVFVDKNFTLLLKNEIDGDVIETKVNLKNLNPNDGGMTLVPDLEAGQFPGLKVFVLEGKEGVTITKNGKLVSEERELAIFLPNRPDIERITPAISQALNVVHKKH